LRALDPFCRLTPPLANSQASHNIPIDALAVTDAVDAAGSGINARVFGADKAAARLGLALLPAAGVLLKGFGNTAVCVRCGLEPWFALALLEALQAGDALPHARVWRAYIVTAVTIGGAARQLREALAREIALARPPACLFKPPLAFAVINALDARG